ncbi:MAG: hypothetical protein HC817_13020, partial [Saprospiraceae bacterium]|nr:hypothetical protein [Saprospiraceae bacterium]
MKKILTLVAFCYAADLLFAADVVAVLPLTDKILMVQFDEGYAIFHKNGQKRTDESMFVDTLNVTKASLLTSYLIASTDDAAYATAKNPTDLSRKSKGTSFAHLCEGWGGAAVGCVNKSIDHAKEHWVYLFLPNALQSGKTYTLKLGNLAKNKTEITFKFDETVIRSEAIHVNNMGYVPSAAQKFGYISHWLGSKGGLDVAAYANKNFKIINQANKTVAFTGKIAFRKNKSNVETTQTDDTPNQNFASADVYECNFSAFTTPGEYVLSVDEMGCSFPFKISADAYREPYFWTMKGLYHNRSGIALLAKHTDWPRPAPHNPKLTPGFAQKLKYTSSRYFDWSNSDNDSRDKPTI